MDDNIAQFVAITSADPQKAAQYLRLADNSVEQAVELFFEDPNLDVGTSNLSPPEQPSERRIASNARTNYGGSRRQQHADVMELDSSDEGHEDLYADDGQLQSNDANQSASSATNNPTTMFQDDEAIARRLQEELFSAGDSTAAPNVRAPMARTTETLVGPGASWGSGSDDLDAAVADQLARRRRGPHGRPGIFNQRATPSVWDSPDGGDADARRRNLSRATGGASDMSTKSNLLAEMYRPPFELMSRMSWDEARDEGKRDEKWILVNVQDPAIFDCQVLNRDIWKDPQIKETIKENFIFMQFSKDDPAGSQYIQYYFHAHDSQNAYPHIAIVDPRTGEQLKVWSGPPVPKAMELLHQLHEFLDRYSLKAHARNPVATRKSEKKKVDVDRLTEDEMLEMAMKNSLANNDGPREEDPDELTRISKGKDKVTEYHEDVLQEDLEKSANGINDEGSSAFARISALRPHTEPSEVTGSTRIQFRYSGGRQIRRFALSDQVRRMYEWLKATPFEGTEGLEFELIFMGKNLIDALEQSIEEIGLKNGTVMVEFNYE